MVRKHEMLRMHNFRVVTHLAQSMTYTRGLLAGKRRKRLFWSKPSQVFTQGGMHLIRSEKPGFKKAGFRRGAKSQQMACLLLDFSPQRTCT